MAVTERERKLEAENEWLRQRVAELEARIKELEKLLGQKAESKASKPPKFSENYSLDHNGRPLGGDDKRRRRGKSTGRRPSHEKTQKADSVVDLFPPEIDPELCVYRGRQFVWRIVDGKAVYVQYNLYAPADASTLPMPPGVRNRRSEYAVEIIITLAFLHYWIGISIDKAREVIGYFTGLEISKSQANSLLNQLANDWNEDYEAVAQLIALQMIVYVDETGWKVGRQSRYTWAFSCATYVLFLGSRRNETRRTLRN